MEHLKFLKLLPKKKTEKVYLLTECNKSVIEHCL